MEADFYQHAYHNAKAMLALKDLELIKYELALELACDNLAIYTSPTSDKWKVYYLEQATKEINNEED